MDYKIVLILSIIAVFCSCSRLPVKEVDEEPCPCNKIYFPLCGSDGVTYDNLCRFNCRADHLWKNEKIRLVVVKEDECDTPDEVFDYV